MNIHIKKMLVLGMTLNCAFAVIANAGKITGKQLDKLKEKVCKLENKKFSPSYSFPLNEKSLGYKLVRFLFKKKYYSRKELVDLVDETVSYDDLNQDEDNALKRLERFLELEDSEFKPNYSKLEVGIHDLKSRLFIFIVRELSVVIKNIYNLPEIYKKENVRQKEKKKLGEIFNVLLDQSIRLIFLSEEKDSAYEEYFKDEIDLLYEKCEQDLEEHPDLKAQFEKYKKDFEGYTKHTAKGEICARFTLDSMLGALKSDIEIFSKKILSAEEKENKDNLILEIFACCFAAKTAGKYVDILKNIKKKKNTAKYFNKVNTASHVTKKTNKQSVDNGKTPSVPHVEPEPVEYNCELPNVEYVAPIECNWEPQSLDSDKKQSAPEFNQFNQSVY